MLSVASMLTFARSPWLMRIFPVLLVCLALATCSSHLLLPQVTTPAQPGLRDLSSVQLIAVSASNDSQAPSERTALLTSLLRDGLSLRGYREGSPAQLRAYYWLGLRREPVELSTDLPPPGLLGPYQSVHRLKEERATLHLRLTDLQDQVLWEGQVDTGLSPAWDSDEQLHKASNALLLQVPMAR